MILDIWTQLGYFFSTVVAGLLVGLMFDIYRIFRGINPPNKIVAAISDILFWVLQALVVFVFLIATNNGDLRYYTFIGIILGLFVYFKLISKVIQIIVIRSIFFISKVFSIIKNIILIPFKLLTYIFGYLCVNVKELSGEIHKKRVSKKINKKKEKLALKKNKETKNKDTV